MYIEPTLHIHATLTEAKKFLDTYRSYYFLRDKENVGISDVAQGKRNLIIGEPGVGKTELLHKLRNFLTRKGISNRLIDLKDPQSIGMIAEYLISSNDVADRALLLDGLDEVKGTLFPSMLDKIEEVSRDAGYPKKIRYIMRDSIIASDIFRVFLRPRAMKKTSKPITALCRKRSRD
jgi:hypothetical protein